MSTVLIIEARYYGHLSDLGLRGIKATLDESYAKYDLLTVPGCLEIPAALKFAKDQYDAFVLLGCVIRGETSHYEMVSTETFRGVYNLITQYDLAVGNAVQTVENEAQAMERLSPEHRNKGGEAAKAALRMLQIKQRYLDKARA